MHNTKWIILFLIMAITLVFSNCDTPKNEVADKSEYLNKGKKIALAAKAELGQNLMRAIHKQGTANALEFCNLRAIPLTDSIAIAQHAKIKRVSDKNRNPQNAANKKELAYIQKAKKEIQTNGKAKPMMSEVGNKMMGYYPIVTNGMCLQCHGKPDVEIKAETMAMLQEKYPQDLAKNYLANQIRGIWVIELEK